MLGFCLYAIRFSSVIIKKITEKIPTLIKTAGFVTINQDGLEFMVKKREPYRNKLKSGFYLNFKREPYHPQMVSVLRFIADENGKVDVFWYL